MAYEANGAWAWGPSFDVGICCCHHGSKLYILQIHPSIHTQVRSTQILFLKMSSFNSLLADLEVCQGSTDTSDMVIECENEEIPVHSQIISLRYGICFFAASNQKFLFNVLHYVLQIFRLQSHASDRHV